MANRDTIAEQWSTANNARRPILDRMRRCAAMTIPRILPPEDQTERNELPRPYQGLGAEGVSNLTGRLLTALFPQGIPWFLIEPSVETRNAVEAGMLTAEELGRFQKRLYSRQLLIQQQLDQSGYRKPVRKGIEDGLVVGNWLLRMDDDYRLHHYRADNYVQRRDSSGQLTWFILREKKRRDQLDSRTLERAKLGRKPTDDQTAAGEKLNLYTRGERQKNGSWQFTQELNEHVVNESEEPVNPFLAGGYVELEGEDSARSFIEDRLPDLESLNNLFKDILDAAGMAAKKNPVVDPAGLLTPADLMKEPGEVLIGNVREGVAVDVGYIQTGIAADLNIPFQVAQSVQERLSKAMLLRSEALPTGERVTATQVMEITEELEGALGGVFTHIAEEFQKPLLDRITYQMERDNKIEPLGKEAKDAMSVRILTGAEALTQQAAIRRLTGAVQQIAAMFPEGMDRIDQDEAAMRIVRAQQIDTQGLIRSDEEVAQIRRARQQAAMQEKMAETGIETAGEVVKQAAGRQGSEG